MLSPACLLGGYTAWISSFPAFILGLVAGRNLGLLLVLRIFLLVTLFWLLFRCPLLVGLLHHLLHEDLKHRGGKPVRGVISLFLQELLQNGVGVISERTLHGLE